MTPILSILIPTIPGRQEMFGKLLAKVAWQKQELERIHPTLGTVQFIYDSRDTFLNKGPSIGKKRESLVSHATGKYLCFLDDDENISPSYVESLVRLCHHNRDICTFRSISKLDNFWMMVDMSLNYQNDQPSPKYMIRRKPWTICPVRSEFAKEFTFPDTNYSEDSDWMEKVLTRCANEAHTEEILHEYRHSKKTSEADKITKYVQSIK